MIDGRCSGGWGRPLAEHYSVAWLDRWLKKPGEAGFDTADARLLADADWVERYSFYSKAARAFASRDGALQLCEDIRAGCVIAPAVPALPMPAEPPAMPPSTVTPTAPAATIDNGGRFGGGAFGVGLLALWLAMAVRRRRRRR